MPDPRARLPTPYTPFAEVSEAWHLKIQCSCRLVVCNKAFRFRHYPPDMTAADVAKRAICKKCGKRAVEVAWEEAYPKSDWESRVRVVVEGIGQWADRS